ncbi:MAG: TAXI family TRAP transporter solute-binding subunit, partial [Pseudomonadota bacterium]
MNEKAQNQNAPGLKAATNATSKSKRSMRIFSFTFIVFTLFIGATGWFWINRAQEPEVIMIGTGPLGSDAYNLMKEVSQVVQRHSDDLRIEVRPTRDASQNIALLNTDAIDAAVIRSDTPVVADIRGITNLYPDIFQIIVRDDVSAYRIGDLANISISIPEFGSDGFRSFWVVGDHYDLPIDSMVWKAEPFEQGAGRLLAGDVDALFTVRSLRDSHLIRMFEEAQLKSIEMRFIAIDQAESIALKRPFLSSAIIPKGAFTGAAPVPRSAIPTSSVDRLLVTRED